MFKKKRETFSSRPKFFRLLFLPVFEMYRLILTQLFQLTQQQRQRQQQQQKRIRRRKFEAHLIIHIRI